MKHLLILTLAVAFACSVSAQNVPSQQDYVSSGTTDPLVSVGFSAGMPINAVRTAIPRIRALDESFLRINPTLTQLNYKSEFYDGLGRLMQTVGYLNSLYQSNLVAPIALDSFGREQYQFMPYATISSGSNGATFNGSLDTAVKINAFSEDVNFQKHVYPAEQPTMGNEQYFFSKTVFERAPLNRPLIQYAPGNSWVGSGVGTSIAYGSNESADHVQLFFIDNNPFSYSSSNDDTANIPYTSGEYPLGELSKTATTDEQGAVVILFTDKSGNVVLKRVQAHDPAVQAGYSWLETYYIYDDFARLRFVVTPKAAAYLRSNNWVFTATVVSELCFRYEYDGRGRNIAKKVPGAAWEYTIFDMRDRPVFTQNGSQRSNGQYMYTFYDLSNRPVETGIASNIISVFASAAGMQNIMGSTDNQVIRDFPTTNTHNDYNDFKLTVSDVPTFIGATFTTLTVSIYDYGVIFRTLSTKDYSRGMSGSDVPAPTNLLKGKLISSYSRVITDPNSIGTGKFNESYAIYNDWGALIQSQVTNHKGGIDTTTNYYSYTGDLMNSYFSSGSPSNGIGGVQVSTQYDLDPLRRPYRTQLKLNNNDSTLRYVNQISYDAMGLKKRKQIGSFQQPGNIQPWLEDDSYSYNIRGWLKSINWTNGLNSTPNISTNGKWFSESISYDYGHTTRMLNGGIAGVKWASQGDQVQRSYGYKYDLANRLIAADFTQLATGANPEWNTSDGVDFSVKLGDAADWHTAYDENGNILQLTQKGLVGTKSQLLDSLTYAYYQNTNKLYSVTDGQAQVPFKLGDFTDRNPVGADYGYDVDGNLITDKNKSLQGSAGLNLTGGGAIQYNIFGKPQVVQIYNTSGTLKGTVSYVYDGSGNRLQKSVNEQPSAANGQVAKTIITDYVNGFQYENGVLQFFSQPEGRVRTLRDTNNTVTGYVFDYMLRDQLGNARTTLTDQQIVDQYPAATLEDGAVTVESNYYLIHPENIASTDTIPGFTDASNASYQNNNGNPPYNTNPTSNTSATSQKMYKVLGAGPNLSSCIKVMAGDKISVFGRSYYSTAVVNSTPPPYFSVTVLSDFVIANLISGPGGQITGHNYSEYLPLVSQYEAPLNAFFYNNPIANMPTNKPYAYIGCLFFDEKLNIIGGQQSWVGANHEVKNHAGELSNIPVPKNGFVLVYGVNMSGQAVYIDNLQTVITHGPLVQEDHYYPYGLSMAGISSKAFNYSESRYKFGGKELESKEFSDTTGLDSYDFDARSYDQQIGRWQGIDNLASKSPEWSGYTYAKNNPITFVDPNGKFDLNITGSNAKDALVELQKAAGDYISLSMGEDGTVRYVKNPTTLNGPGEIPDNSNAALLMKIIDDKSVSVNVKAENTKYTSTGQWYVGGAFMGTEYNKFAPIGTPEATTHQEINPSVLSLISSTSGSPGTDIMHEVSESYIGGVITKKTGDVSGPATATNGLYLTAHKYAVPQSGIPSYNFFDANGNQLIPVNDHDLPKGIKTYNVSMLNQQGKPVIIQTFP